MQLTGFSEAELLGTGTGDLYLVWLLRVFGDVTPELLTAWRTIESDYPPADRQAALKESILADAKLGPFARSVLMLWYTATWTPPEGTSHPGKHPENVARAFGAAYPEGLMWRAAVGAHPSAAKPTGFGTWGFPPEGT